MTGQAFLEWILVDNRLCAVRLNGSARTRKVRDTRRCHFVVSAYAHTDCRPGEAKDQFFRELTDLLHRAEHSNSVLMTGDFNAQIGILNHSERRLGGCFGIPT